MDIQVVLTTKDEAAIIIRLWPLYLYDLSEFGEMPINAHGLFEEEALTDYDYNQALKIWWEKPGLLYPFLIRAEGRAAGFALVGASPGHAPKGRDFFIHEFFLLRPFRGQGIGEIVATRIFDQLPGRWELRAMPGNPRAQGFWRKTLGRYTAGQYTEATRATGDEPGIKVIFQFDNRSESSLAASDSEPQGNNHE